MSSLDMLPQNMPRRVDAQAPRTDAPMGKNEQGGQAPAGSGDFTSLLQGMGEGRSRPGSSTPQGASAADADPADAKTDARTGADQTSLGAEWLVDLFQTVASDGSSDQDAAAQQTDQPDGSSVTALAALLPRLLEGAQALAANGREQPPGSASSGAADTGPALRDDGLAGLTQPSVLKVAVQKQETHFRPVLQGFTVKAVPQGGGVHAGAAAIEPDGSKASTAGAPDGKSNSGTQFGPAVSSLSDATAPSELAAAAEEPSAPGRSMMERQSPRTEAQTAQHEVMHGSQEPSSLPQPMLHRLAGAVLAHLGSVTAEAGSQSAQGGSAPFLATVKASDNVVRVLSVELHPAELGVVTIRLRLSGDNLEMDLHAASEKTAALLKNDSDRLSALLRDAGYRPDSINIQVGSVDARHDVSPNLRPHSAPQAQQQAFSQGMASHEGRQQQRGSQNDAGQKGARSDANDGDITSDRSTGGIYL